MPKYSLLRLYQNMAMGPLGDLGLHVGTCMTDNPNFLLPLPPFTGPAITILANNYITGCGATVDGNRLTTAQKAVLATALINALDQTADYVELYSSNIPPKMLSCGLPLASTSHAQAPVGTTGILSVTNLATTKLELELLVAAHA
jgi:hypothetical protein